MSFCKHGWRGMPAEPIYDLCPSCGQQSLFIGSGGHLTCSVIGCKQPGVTSAIEALRTGRLLAERERDEATAALLLAHKTLNAIQDTLKKGQDMNDKKLEMPKCSECGADATSYARDIVEWPDFEKNEMQAIVGKKRKAGCDAHPVSARVFEVRTKEDAEREAEKL